MGWSERVFAKFASTSEPQLLSHKFALFASRVLSSRDEKKNKR